jgi:hypothetical protein
MQHRIAALLAGSLVLMPTFASAQDGAAPSGEREFAIEEIAADLTYGFCPLYLVGQFPLTGNPQLAERGFGEAITRTPTQAGVLETVELKRPDGTVDFGGYPDQSCMVVVTDADAAKVFDKLRQNMSFMGLDFQAAGVQNSPEGQFQYFKAPFDGQMLYVQLGRIIEPQTKRPVVTARMYGSAE